MPISSIPLFEERVSLGPDASLKQALLLLLEKQVNHLAICEADGRFVGLLSTNAILHALMPTSATVPGGLSSLRFTGDAIRLLTSHLQNLETLRACDFLNKSVTVMQADDPILEAANRLAESTAPLPIINSDGTLLGVLSRRALLAYLLKHEQDK